MLYIVGPGQPKPAGARLINSTSHSDDFGRALSPFLLGPVSLYGGRVAMNVENGWQYAKLYEQHAGPDGAPADAYWRWAEAGWSRRDAVRYPMGKGAKPLCSVWDGELLGYIEARKRIYIPLYTEGVLRTGVIDELRSLSEKEDIALFDFDGYREDRLGMSLYDVVHNDARTMGHAFVVKLLVEYGRSDIDRMHDEGVLGPQRPDAGRPAQLGLF